MCDVRRRNTPVNVTIPSSWFYTLIVVNGSTVSVSAPSLGLSYSWTEARFPKGSVGLLSKGTGFVANTTAVVDCDSGGQQCSNAFTNQRCTFACGAGYGLLSGNATRTCVAGNWSDSPLVCGIRT